MNGKFSLMSPFVRYAAILMVGCVGGMGAKSAIAQRSPATIPPMQMAQSSSIEGSWRLANMTAPGSPMPMLPAAKTPLTAEFAGDRLAGSGGCNRFMGGFETTGDQLKVGPLASTFKACEPAVMNQETMYLKALQGAQRYEVSDQGLQIFYQTDAGEGVLRYTAQGVRALW